MIKSEYISPYIPETTGHDLGWKLNSWLFDHWSSVLPVGLQNSHNQYPKSSLLRTNYSLPYETVLWINALELNLDIASSVCVNDISKVYLLFVQLNVWRCAIQSALFSSSPANVWSPCGWDCYLEDSDIAHWSSKSKYKIKSQNLGWKNGKTWIKSDLILLGLKERICKLGGKVGNTG